MAFAHDEGRKQTLLFGSFNSRGVGLANFFSSGLERRSNKFFQNKCEDDTAKKSKSSARSFLFSRKFTQGRTCLTFAAVRKLNSLTVKTRSKYCEILSYFS